MKAIILKDRFHIEAVFIRNDISDKDIQQLQAVADTYMQEIVVKEITPITYKDGIGEMINEIRALNETGDDDEHR